MVHSAGYRKGTRYLFKKKFKTRGAPPVSTYLRTFKIGDVVDIKGNPSVQKGLPFKLYHGKTGKVWNITPRGIGVEVKRHVRGKLFTKRLLLRTEHVFHSKSDEDASKKKKKVSLPRAKKMIVSKTTQKIEEVSVAPYIYLI